MSLIGSYIIQYSCYVTKHCLFKLTFPDWGENVRHFLSVCYHSSLNTRIPISLHHSPLGSSETLSAPCLNLVPRSHFPMKKVLHLVTFSQRLLYLYNSSQKFFSDCNYTTRTCFHTIFQLPTTFDVKYFL